MEIIEIFDGPLFESQMIKNLLENDSVECFIKDEISGSISFNWKPGGGVKVMIFKKDYERASQVVDLFEKSRQNE